MLKGRERTLHLSDTLPNEGLEAGRQEFMQLAFIHPLSRRFRDNPSLELAAEIVNDGVSEVSAKLGDGGESREFRQSI